VEHPFDEMIPDCEAKSILKYAYDTLGLSSVEARRVLYDAYDLANSIDTLLSGGSSKLIPSIMREDRQPGSQSAHQDS
jgi:hypothetical protein